MPWQTAAAQLWKKSTLQGVPWSLRQQLIIWRYFNMVSFFFFFFWCSHMCRTVNIQVPEGERNEWSFCTLLTLTCTIKAQNQIHQTDNSKVILYTTCWYTFTLILSKLYIFFFSFFYFSFFFFFSNLSKATTKLSP